MKLIKLILFLFVLISSNVSANENINFEKWKKNFKKVALDNDISEKTFDQTMQNVKFLPKVI